MYLIKEASQLSGVTVRTLHHYDEIGLLKAARSDNGYRYYDQDEIEKIKIIKYYRLLGFSLKQIQEIINNEPFNVIEILESQLFMLEEEKKNINLIINDIKQMILSKKQETSRSSDDFNGFTILDNIKYQSKAIQKYGKDTMIESNKRQLGRELAINEQFNSIFRKFAIFMKNNKPINDTEVFNLCKELHTLFNNYIFDCPIDIFEQIGKNYYDNSEFRMNIDKYSDGLSLYISKSVTNYVSNLSNSS